MGDRVIRIQRVPENKVKALEVIADRNGYQNTQEMLRDLIDKLIVDDAIKLSHLDELLLSRTKQEANIMQAVNQVSKDASEIKELLILNSEEEI